MKLLKLPAHEIDVIEVGICGRMPGKMNTTDVEIVVQDELLGDDQLEDTFRTLKYGPMPDLYDAMHTGKKITKIEFEKDNIILYGVYPIKMERSATFKGRVFTCKIDHFEMTN